MDFLRALINFESLQFAFIAGIFIGVIAPLIGSVVVIRRLSFIADTLSHFSLAGVTFGVFLSKIISPNLININPIIMGIVFSIAGTFLIEKLRGFYKNYKELSMPIVMSFGVALSGLFIAITPGISTSFTTNLLFGSIMSVDRSDIIIILIFSVSIFVFATLFYKQIITLCFDEIFARVSGINVKVLQLGITIVLALAISIFIDLVGVLLIASLLIVPVAASILVGNSFKGTIILSIIFSEVSILFGFYFAYDFDLPVGPSVVLLNILVLATVMIITNIRTIKFKNKETKNNETKV